MDLSDAWFRSVGKDRPVIPGNALISRLGSVDRA